MLIYRTAWVALISVIVLVFVGAIVRATGSGLGCPDWPTCWGCLIPPTEPEQIDVESLDLQKFRRQASRRGIDPETITRETVLASFDPMRTWIEFINRLTSLPLGFSTLLLAFVSFRATRHRKWIIGLAWFSLIDVLFNAWMGAVVVRSGLQPGIITTHMALAFFLICVLVSIVHLSRPREDVSIPASDRKRLLVGSAIFFACLFAEGLMGSQVREQTDLLAEAAVDSSRSEWIAELSSTTIYIVHRSFSWALLIVAGWLLWSVHRQRPELQRHPNAIFAIVVAMMLMGVILAHVAVYRSVQVLHVGMTAVLLAVTWSWMTQLWLQAVEPEN